MYNVNLITVYKDFVLRSIYKHKVLSIKIEIAENQHQMGKINTKTLIVMRNKWN